MLEQRVLWAEPTMNEQPGTTLRQDVYKALKAMILNGEVRPGDRLAERKLTKRLAVSRTPLREALNRLERDGLVTSEPRRGYYVLELDAKAIEDMLVLRENLDALAAQLAAEFMEPGQRDALRDVMKQIDSFENYPGKPIEEIIREIRIGLRVHEIIAQSTGNQLLIDCLIRIYERLSLLIWIEVLYLDDWELTREEHRKIVDAVITRNANAAAEMAREHVRRSRKNILRVVKAQAALRGIDWRVPSHV